MDHIFDMMLTVFRDTFDDPDLQITPETTAADIPAWDSLAHVSLIINLERAFSIRFSIAEVNGLKCVGDLRGLISLRREGRG